MPARRSRGRAGSPRRRLEDAAEALRPEETRPRAIASLERVFREGSAPDPTPEGFLPGRLVATTTWGPLDAFGRWMAARWMPWLGKSFDTFGPCGPALVTPDEAVVDGAIEISLELNGETMQSASTDDLVFSVAALTSHLSRLMTLEPGDIVSTGTPSGVGSVRQPRVWLEGGD